MHTAGLPTQLQPVSHTSLVLQGLRQTLPLLRAMHDHPPGHSLSSPQGEHASPSPAAASPQVPVARSQTLSGGHPSLAQSSVAPATHAPFVHCSPSAQEPQSVPHTSPQTAPVEPQVSLHPLVSCGAGTQRKSVEQTSSAPHVPQLIPQMSPHSAPSPSQVIVHSPAGTQVVLAQRLPASQAPH